MPASAATILVVDEEPDQRALYELTLLRAGYRVETAANLAGAQSHLELFVCDVIVCSIRHRHSQGLALLQWLQSMGRPERCIALTSEHPINFTLEALRAGAFDCLTLPANLPHFCLAVASAVRHNQQAFDTPNARAAAHSERLSAHNALQQLIGSSPAIQHIKQRIPHIAPSMAPVLIMGEAGTGKELLARTLHACSHRAQGPWVTFHCRSVPEHALDLVFFGGRSPTDASSTAPRAGLFQIAKGGTLLIHAVDALPPGVQAKLLQVLQKRLIAVPGQGTLDAVDVRILSATHCDLRTLAHQGLFHPDLCERLAAFELTVPPLRERREDLPALCNVLLARMAHELGIHPPDMSPSLQLQLMQMPLHGNVYELKHLLHQSMAMQHSAPTLRSDSPSARDDSTEAAMPLPATAALRAPYKAVHYAPAPYFPSGVVNTSAPLAYQTTVVRNHDSPHHAAPSRMPSNTHAASASILPSAVMRFPPLLERPLMTELRAPSAPQTQGIHALHDSIALPHSLPEWLDEQERRILLHALQLHGYNRSAAAARLGISLRQMRYRIERLQIPMEADDTAPHRTHDL